MDQLRTDELRYHIGGSSHLPVVIPRATLGNKTHFQCLPMLLYYVLLKFVVRVQTTGALVKETLDLIHTVVHLRWIRWFGNLNWSRLVAFAFLKHLLDKRDFLKLNYKINKICA